MMDLHEISLPDLAHLVASGRAGEELGVAVGVPAVRVVGGRAGTAPAPESVGSLPCVLLADESSAGDGPMEGVVDAFVPRDQWPAVCEVLSSAPQAAVSLALLLRGGETRSIEAGLVAESATYSMLQSGPEFAAWLAERRSRPSRRAPADASPVLLTDRDGDVVRLTLNRPHVHNAWSTDLRDEICAALGVALADETIARVELRGAGPSFCSGGDLSQFGSLPDPVTAHTVRLARSPARLLAQLHDRVVTYLHGACMGAGIEMPSFGDRVVAHPDTVIALPEVPLGLVPGAGGTVSIPRRIGRHRTALLALSGMRLDAETALAWGLVDEIDAGAR